METLKKLLSYLTAHLVNTQKRRDFLIVEDSLSDAELFAEDVKQIGGTPHIVHSAYAAFEAIRTRSFDVALIDFRLPDMNGWLVFSRIKNQHPNTFCIFVVGEPSDLRVLKQGSSCGVIVKDDSIATGLRQQLSAQVATDRSVVALFIAIAASLVTGYMLARPEILIELIK